MSAYAESNNNAALWLLVLLAAAFIIAAYSVPVGDNALLHQSGEYCTCPACGVQVMCGDIYEGKCSACRWMEQHRGGRHARH